MCMYNYSKSGSGSVLISQEALTGVFHVSPAEEGPAQTVGETGRQTCDSEVIPMILFTVVVLVTLHENYKCS